jgi:uncharacterized protein YxjI
VSERALTSSTSASALQRFDGYERLTVRQRKKWLEILLSFEMKNSYQVFDEEQRAVLEVKESDSGFLAFIGRIFLGPIRPFHSDITDLVAAQVVLRLHRRFRFIFHQLDVYAGNGDVLGRVVKKWSWIRRIYNIEDKNGAVLAQLYGPMLKPWTFEIRINDQVMGEIKKRWSGFGKELFTDADNFGIELGGIKDPSLKALAFAATVLIDVVHFERAK